jgi:hypothetical protein
VEEGINMADIEVFDIIEREMEDERVEAHRKSLTGGKIPYSGMMVHFVLPGECYPSGDHRPAVIVYVKGYGLPMPVCNLQVFMNDETDDYKGVHFWPDVPYTEPYSKEGMSGYSWHWPERE